LFIESVEDYEEDESSKDYGEEIGFYDLDTDEEKGRGEISTRLFLIQVRKYKRNVTLNSGQGKKNSLLTNPKKITQHRYIF